MFCYIDSHVLVCIVCNETAAFSLALLSLILANALLVVMGRRAEEYAGKMILYAASSQ